MRSYWSSVAAMAARFLPKPFVASSCANCVRFAATTEGGTTEVNVDPKAAAAACAEEDNCRHCAAVARNQVEKARRTRSSPAWTGHAIPKPNAESTAE